MSIAKAKPKELNVLCDELLTNNSEGNIHFQLRFRRVIDKNFPAGKLWDFNTTEKKEALASTVDALYWKTIELGAKFFSRKNSQEPMKEYAAKSAIESAIRSFIKKREAKTTAKKTAKAPKTPQSDDKNSTDSSVSSQEDINPRDKSNNKKETCTRKRVRKELKTVADYRKRMLPTIQYIEKFPEGFTALQWMRSQRRRDLLQSCDVLCKSGGDANVIPGNQKLQDLVRKYYDAYNLAKTNERSQIADKILSEVNVTGGRFLRLDDVGVYQITGHEAKKKIMQCFRDTRKARRRPFQTQQQPHAYSHTTHKWSWKKAQLPYTPTKEEQDQMTPFDESKAPTMPRAEQAAEAIMEDSSNDDDDNNNDDDTNAATGSDYAQSEDATEENTLKHAPLRRLSSSNQRDSVGGKSRHRRALPLGKKASTPDNRSEKSVSPPPGSSPEDSSKEDGKPVGLTLQEHDVLAHNSEESINHPGTKGFMKLAMGCSEKWKAAKPEGKTMIVNSIWTQICDKGGRFLRLNDENGWVEMRCNQSKFKIAQVLANPYTDRWNLPTPWKPPPGTSESARRRRQKKAREAENANGTGDDETAKGDGTNGGTKAGTKDGTEDDTENDTKDGDAGKAEEKKDKDKDEASKTKGTSETTVLGKDGKPIVLQNLPSNVNIPNQMNTSYPFGNFTSPNPNASGFPMMTAGSPAISMGSGFRDSYPLFQNTTPIQYPNMMMSMGGMTPMHQQMMSNQFTQQTNFNNMKQIHLLQKQVKTLTSLLADSNKEKADLQDGVRELIMENRFKAMEITRLKGISQFSENTTTDTMADSNFAASRNSAVGKVAASMTDAYKNMMMQKLEARRKDESEQALKKQVSDLTSKLAEKDEIIRLKEDKHLELVRVVAEKEAMVAKLKEQVYFYDQSSPTPSVADESEDEDGMEDDYDDDEDQYGSRGIVMSGNRSQLDTLASIAAFQDPTAVTPDSDASVDSDTLRAVETENNAKDVEIEQLKRKISATNEQMDSLEGANDVRDKKIRKLQQDIETRNAKLTKLEAQQGEVVKTMFTKDDVTETKRSNERGIVGN